MCEKWPRTMSKLRRTASCLVESSPLFFGSWIIMNGEADKENKISVHRRTLKLQDKPPDAPPPPFWGGGHAADGDDGSRACRCARPPPGVANRIYAGCKRRGVPGHGRRSPQGWKGSSSRSPNEVSCHHGCTISDEQRTFRNIEDEPGSN